MSEKLKPCPFCGGEAHLSNWTDQAYVWCECGVKTEVYLHSGCVDKAIEAWNRRAEPKRTAKVVHKQQTHIVTPPKSTTIEYETVTNLWDECGNCGAMGMYHGWKYCPNCGVKLEWSE